MTQHDTKRHKKLELMKNLKKIKKGELLGLKLMTGEVFCSDAHYYTIVAQGLHNESW